MCRCNGAGDGDEALAMMVARSPLELRLKEMRGFCERRGMDVFVRNVWAGTQGGIVDGTGLTSCTR